MRRLSLCGETDDAFKRVISGTRTSEFQFKHCKYYFYIMIGFI